jgi:hypothetical protein
LKKEKTVALHVGAEEISPYDIRPQYSDPEAITQYLIEFYSPQGGVEFEYLS